jgi:hypothetical protein
LLEASDLEMVADVGEGSFKRKRFEMGTGGDALSKGLQGIELQQAFEVRLADENESGEGLGVNPSTSLRTAASRVLSGSIRVMGRR